MSESQIRSTTEDTTFDSGTFVDSHALRQTVFETLLGQTWEELEPELRRLCRRWMGGNAADGDEALSRASLAVYRKLPRSRPRIGNLEAWIRRVTFNTCMDLHREKRRRAEVSLDFELLPEAATARRGPFSPEAEGDDPERRVLAHELRAELERAIRALPERLRSTLEVHLEADDYRQVAQRLSITRPNARKRVQQAREALRTRLGNYLRRRC